MIYDSDDWSSWASLPTAIADIPDVAGAYVVRCRGITINRAVGSDEDGVLDIGESAYLQSRLDSFWRCAREPGREGHMAGWRYAHFRFNEKFPLDSLQVKWCRTADKNEAAKLEAALFQVYLDRHKELPPLNYKFNWALWEEE